MGLIDDIRRRNDSWMARFEEHRQESDEHDPDGLEMEDEEIILNRMMVGISPADKERMKT
jgi:hypothetical protein